MSLEVDDMSPIKILVIALREVYRTEMSVRDFEHARGTLLHAFEYIALHNNLP